jgi:phospholipid-binding lipoprotein MlaA
MPAPRRPLWSLVCLAVIVMLAGGCATVAGPEPHDPFERWNRAVYRFNEELDQAIMEPVARGYEAVVPQFARSSVSNFFSNINDVLNVLNNTLQGKFTQAYSDVGRVAMNSTLGLLGLFDIASAAGVERSNEDFGQTLGFWGMPEGPFLMLPLFGPSNGRDLVGRVVDYFTDPVSYVDPSRTRRAMQGTRVVNRRAELLDTTAIIDVAAIDPYIFVRDAYTQRRRALIHDGAPPLDLDLLDLDAPAVPPDPATKRPKPKPEALWRFLREASPRSGTPIEAPGPESVLVSGEASEPVLSPFSGEEAATSQPAATAPRAAAAAAREASAAAMPSPY